MTAKKRSPEMKRMQGSIKEVCSEIIACVKAEDMKTARRRIDELRTRVGEIEKLVRIERKNKEG